MESKKVTNCPSQDLARTNKAILNPEDTYAKFPHLAVRYPKLIDAFVFTVTSDKQVAKGEIAFNSPGRKWASLQTGALIQVAPYQFIPHEQCLASITFIIDFASKRGAPVNMEFNTDQMARTFSELHYNQAFTVGQLFGFVFERVTFELKVKDFQTIDCDGDKRPVEIGLTTANTVAMFEKAEGSDVKLTGSMTSSVAAPQIFSQSWDFSSMGIGGLDEQFNKIFRRAFASRLLPPAFAEAIGESHVRGILLHGPPGTGKTLIARQIGKMLLAREPKIVNGPEILDKYVGESEANIRKLFKEAEEEQAKAGLNSGLHMIIFDEIDAICKSRGTSAGTAGVGDNVVNQLLSKIDGVDSLHNVLLVGMTNRKDLIDEALLRPGRFEVQIEIGIPNAAGRLEIFKIHTKKMREKGILDDSVNLEELAELARNYTGAEIAGLIGAARSLAVNRVVKPDSKDITQELLDTIKVTRADFIYAMEHDVKPALGASEAELKELAMPIIQWDPVVSEIQSDLQSIVKHISNPQVGKSRPYLVLMVGEPGVGLTTLASNMATATSFPFIRVYQARKTATWTESNKVQHMDKLFSDAARSEFSCIVMDNLEGILDYSHIGPRFSNTLQAVFRYNRDLVLPSGHRMLVICTCSSEECLSDLKLFRIFRDVIRVPSVTKPEQVDAYLTQSDDFILSPEQRVELIDSLGSIPFKMGVKNLEELVESAVDDEPRDRVKKFLERMHKLDLVVRTKSVDWSRVDQFL